MLYANGQVDRYPLDQASLEYENHEAKHFGFYLQKGLFEEYAAFGRDHGHDLAPFETYHEVRGLRWPVVDGRETRWRFREGADPPMANTSIFLLHVRDRPLRAQEAGTRDYMEDTSGTYGPSGSTERMAAARTAEVSPYLE